MKFDLNKIYCMDCLEGMKQIPDKSVDLVLTDPPYGINFIPPRENSRLRHGDSPICNDDLLGEDWVEWFQPILNEIYRVQKNDSVGYFFSGFNPYYYYYSTLLSSGYSIKANIIWVKDNFGLGYHFRRQYEQILVGFKGDPPVPEHAISDVIFHKKVRGVALLHSCQKPEQLIHILIKQYSKPNNIVLDPFMGSGTTAVACKQLGRDFIGFEICQEYVDIANKRLEQETLKRWEVSE